MFYGQVWGQAEKDRWFKLTGNKDATTKTLCDTVRMALYEPPGMTMEQLSDALCCAHQALDNVYMTENADRARRVISALEAEMDRLEASEKAKRTVLSEITEVKPAGPCAFGVHAVTGASIVSYAPDADALILSLRCAQGLSHEFRLTAEWAKHLASSLVRSTEPRH